MAERLPTPEEQSGVPFVSKARMAKAKARAKRIRDTANVLWQEVLAAHDEQDWLALGYRSFKSYLEIELGKSEGEGYRLLEQGRVIRAIEAATEDSRARESVSGRQAAALKGDLPAAAGEIAEATKSGAPLVQAVKDAVGRRKPKVIDADSARVGKGGNLLLEPPQQTPAQDSQTKKGPQSGSDPEGDWDGQASEPTDLGRPLDAGEGPGFRQPEADRTEGESGAASVATGKAGGEAKAEPPAEPVTPLKAFVASWKLTLGALDRVPATDHTPKVWRALQQSMLDSASEVISRKIDENLEVAS